MQLQSALYKKSIITLVVIAALVQVSLARQPNRADIARRLQQALSLPENRELFNEIFGSQEEQERAALAAKTAKSTKSYRAKTIDFDDDNYYYAGKKADKATKSYRAKLLELDDDYYYSAKTTPKPTAAYRRKNYEHDDDDEFYYRPKPVVKMYLKSKSRKPEDLSLSMESHEEILGAEVTTENSYRQSSKSLNSVKVAEVNDDDKSSTDAQRDASKMLYNAMLGFVGSLVRMRDMFRVPN